MSNSLNTLIFAGPTLTQEAKQLIKASNLQLEPPIKRNDIELLIKNEFEGKIIIVDGYFKQVLAVGHAEIREALKKGISIFGVSSMGAIRAFEMRHMGMQGFGKTYDWFFKMDDFQDDEVSLYHADAPYYFPISEPLVHFRECVAELLEKKKLSSNASKIIITKLASLYYGERTMELFLKLIKEHSEIDIQELKDNFDKYRIKQLDLIDFLKQKFWLDH